mgnify:CR=1 FL=1
MAGAADAVTGGEQTVDRGHAVVDFAVVGFKRHTPQAQVETYKRDMRFFHNLRAAVRKAAPLLEEDRRLDRDIARVLELLRSDSLPVQAFSHS